MIVKAYNVVKICKSCAHNRIKRCKNATKSRLFPTTKPLGFVSIKIFWSPVEFCRNDKDLLAKTDRFSKLVKTVLSRTTATDEIAEAFTKHWVVLYKPSGKLLVDNEKQLTSCFLYRRVLYPGTCQPAYDHTLSSKEQSVRTLQPYGPCHFLALVHGPPS